MHYSFICFIVLFAFTARKAPSSLIKILLHENLCIPTHIVYLYSTLRFLSTPERKNDLFTFVNKYFVSSSGNRTHNQLILHSHFVPLCYDWPQNILIIFLNLYSPSTAVNSLHKIILFCLTDISFIKLALSARRLV